MIKKWLTLSMLAFMLASSSEVQAQYYTDVYIYNFTQFDPLLVCSIEMDGFDVRRMRCVDVNYGLGSGVEAPFGDFVGSYGQGGANANIDRPQCGMMIQRTDGFWGVAGNSIVFGPEACGALRPDGSTVHSGVNSY